MSERSTTSLLPVSRRWRRAAIGLLLLGGPAVYASGTHGPPPAEAPTASRAAPIDRVAAIRRQLLELDGRHGIEPSADALAQWGNWRNSWANWGNA